MVASWVAIARLLRKITIFQLFHPTSNCPYKIKVLRELKNIPDVQQKYIEPFQDVYQYVESNSGKSIKEPSDMQDIYFNLKCEDDMNYTLPDWTLDVYPQETERAASYVYSYHNYDPIVKQINAGYMLKKILDDSYTKMNKSDSERKIYLYSGHESTVGYMLDALGVQAEEKIPPYGCAISFELRKLGDDYFMKMRYRNDTEATTAQDLKIPGCATMCPIDIFKESVSDILPSVTIEEACSDQ